MNITCPIHASLAVIGDRWSLLVVRDLLFAGYRTFNEFLHSGQGIATNILTDRIKGLLDAGIIVKAADPGDGRKWIYSLTQKGFALAPVLLELSKWGSTYENGVAPPGVLERWQADPVGLLAELRQRAGLDEAALSSGERGVQRSKPQAQRRSSTAASEPRHKKLGSTRRK